MLSDEIKSVYVRNLSPTVSPSEVEEEFKSFGRIRPDGVVIRSRKVNVFSSSNNYINISTFISHYDLCISVSKLFTLSQDVGVCYAFVEFEDMSGVQNAVKVLIFSYISLRNVVYYSS